MRLGGMLCFALLSLGLGCGSEGSSTAVPTGEPSSTVYFVLDGSEWALDEAIDRRQYLSSEGLPSLDWYAEYERVPTGDEPREVRLSGQDAGPDEVRDELPGFDLRPVEVRGGDGLGGTGPDGRSVVLFEAEDGYTMLLESDGLDADGLRTWADGLRRATEDEWIAAGGVKPRCCGRDDR